MSRLDHINLENKVDALAARVRKIEEMLAAIMTDGEPAALEGAKLDPPTTRGNYNATTNLNKPLP